MHSNSEQLAEQLQWFTVAYSKKHRIKLSFAMRTIEIALSYPLQADDVYNFLKEQRYKHIDVDVQLSYASRQAVSKELLPEKANYQNISNDIDEIDDILSQPLQPKHQIEPVSLKEPSMPSYRMNEYMLKDYTQGRNELLKQNIVVANMNLVYSEVKRYKNYMNHNLSEEDLHHEGVIGLMDAIERFDPTMGGAFSTYAVYWIRQRVIRSIMNYGTTVRVPVHLIELIRKIKKIEAQFNGDNNEKADIEEICTEIGITKKQYYDAKLAEHRYLSFTSLNQQVGTGDESETELSDFVPNDRLEIFVSMPREFLDPYELTEQRMLQENVAELLCRLQERERKVIEYRFGLLDGRSRTLEDVGRIFGLTRERIRQIESKALRHLRAVRNREKWIWIS
ncbi:RNA polymerase primary sigma factor [Paenibacillus endophyticus]|uniref:RNA polymerase primary sigma factor n=1 Tax=Paenibacillus endophyticus TaxID=1294268 RepID=A0A7W5GD12_9BACL|nr:sigma-70 family RNA polymerase sigma factor [Paenibacillus endophyticus]MBB3155456.1 RNA polymerase primary sigma factor [Paenibacillus endophyticus]